MVAGATTGSVPDYQVSAWLMAVLLRGMSADETAMLTDAMVRSGAKIDLSSIPGDGSTFTVELPLDVAVQTDRHRILRAD